MTRKQLEQQREGVEAQMRWAVLHGGDQELLDLLRVESDCLSVMIGQRSAYASAGRELGRRHPRDETRPVNCGKGSVCGASRNSQATTAR
jgi:hypothetical protein